MHPNAPSHWKALNWQICFFPSDNLSSFYQNHPKISAILKHQQHFGTTCLPCLYLKHIYIELLLSRDFIPIRICASSMSYLAGLAIWKIHRGSSSQSCISYGPWSWRKSLLTNRKITYTKEPRKIRSQQKQVERKNIIFFVRTEKKWRFKVSNKKNIKGPKSQIYAICSSKMLVFLKSSEMELQAIFQWIQTNGSLRASFRVQQETSREKRGLRCIL